MPLWLDSHGRWVPGDGLISEASFESVEPSVIEHDAVDRRDDVDADRFDADLKDEPRASEVVDGEIVQGRTERGDNAPGVFGFRSNPQVQILSGAHQAMSGKCVGPDYEELNASCVESG